MTISARVLVPPARRRTVRDRAVEAQRVALLELLDGAVEVDLEGAAGDVDRDLAAGDGRLGRPAAAGTRSTRAGRGAGIARELAEHAAALLVTRAFVAADDPHGVAAAGRRPQVGDRHVQRGGDPLDRADARPGEPALDLREKRMREPGQAAEAP